MTSHCRHDERRRAPAAHILTDTLDDGREVRDAAAADGNSHTGARVNERVELIQLLPKHRHGVGELSGIELLPKFDEMHGCHRWEA